MRHRIVWALLLLSTSVAYQCGDPAGRSENEVNNHQAASAPEVAATWGRAMLITLHDEGGALNFSHRLTDGARLNHQLKIKRMSTESWTFLLTVARGVEATKKDYFAGKAKITTTDIELSFYKPVSSIIKLTIVGPNKLKASKAPWVPHMSEKSIVNVGTAVFTMDSLERCSPKQVQGIVDAIESGTDEGDIGDMVFNSLHVPKRLRVILRVGIGAGMTSNRCQYELGLMASPLSAYQRYYSNCDFSPMTPTNAQFADGLSIYNLYPQDHDVALDGSNPPQNRPNDYLSVFDDSSIPPSPYPNLDLYCGSSQTTNKYVLIGQLPFRTTPFSKGPFGNWVRLVSDGKIKN